MSALPHSVKIATQQQPAKMLGGAYRLHGIFVPGQHAADLRNLCERRPSGKDTILSGIISLAHSNVGVAAIVFIASILVPFTKVVVMFTLLISIHFKCEQGLRTRILLLRFVTGLVAGRCWICS